MNPSEKPVPGFLRLYVVNSKLMNGRVETIPLVGNTLLSGDNGVGKTSLLLLAPLFFGAEPRNIVSSNSAKDGFVSYYMPTNCSYLAADYINANGMKRSVIMTARNDKMIYHFLHGHIDQYTFFLQEDRKTFVKVEDITSHLRALGVHVHSRQIESSKEFRSIIQGFIPTGSMKTDRSAFAGVIAEYGIGRLSAPIRNLDNILVAAGKGVFDIQDMLSILSSNAAGPQEIDVFGGMQSELLKIRQEYNSYNRISAKEPSLRVAEEHLAIYRAEEENMATSIAKLAGACQGAKDRLNFLDGELQNLQSIHEDEDQNLGAELNALRGMRADTENQIKNARKDLDVVLKMQQDLLEKDADQAATLRLELPSLIASIENSERRLAALNGDIDTIHAKYNSIIAKIKEVSAVEEVQISHALRELSTQEVELNNKSNSDLIALHKEIGDQLAAGRADLNAKLNSAASDEMALLRNLVDFKPSESLQAQLNSASERLTFQKKTAASLESKHKSLCSQLDLAVKNLKDSTSKKEELTHSLASSREKFAKMVEQMSPPAGSFEGWLDQNVDDWKESIAKVIPADLLVRTDLTPHFNGNGDTVFGVSLDVSKLKSCAPDRSDLQAKIDAHPEAEDRLTKLLGDAKSAEERYAKERSALSREANSVNAELEVVRKQVVQTEIKIKTCREEIAIEQADFSEAIQERILACQARQAEITSALKRLDQQFEAERIKREADLEVAKAPAHARIKDAQAALKERDEDVRKKYGEQLVQVEQERDAAIASNGSSSDQITNIQSEISGLKSKVAHLQSLESDAFAWSFFQKEKEPAIEQLKQAIADFNRDVEKYKAQISDVEQARSEKSSAFRKQKSDLDTEISRISALISRANVHLADFGSEAIETEYGQIDELIAIIHASRKTQSESRNVMSKSVRILISVFQDAYGSARDSYLAAASKLGDGPAPEDWVAHFSEWFESGYETMRSNFLNSLPMTCGTIVRSYRSMIEFDDRIKGMNRQLRKALSSATGFHNIRDVDLTVYSAISNLPYYGALSDFVNCFHKNEARSDMDSVADLIEYLDKLMSYWSVGQGTMIKLNDHIEIAGSFMDGDQKRILHKNADLAQYSSNGGATVLRIIILCAALKVARGDSRMMIPWCVDELAHLDARNTTEVIRILNEADIHLVATAPSLDESLRTLFEHRLNLSREKGGTAIHECEKMEIEE